MRPPRMSTRRWIVVVVITAVTVYAGIEGRRIGRLRSRRAAALRHCQAAMRWFEDGRIDLERGVNASENLLEAELALSTISQDRIAALSAHLKRAQHMIESLKNEPPPLHVDYDADIRKAEFALDQWREELIKIVAPAVHARHAEEAKTDEGRAIARIRRIGGVVIRDDSRPGRPVIEVGMPRLGIDDEDMFALRPLNNLRRLNVGASVVTDAGLAALEGLTDLEELDVSFSAITRAGFLRLKGLPHLHGLDLASTGVEDRDLVIPGELVLIEKLDLAFNRITGVGLASLQGLTKLKDLCLSGNPITDAGLRNLKGWINLRTLKLYDTLITDEGLPHLAGLTNLEGIDLSYTTVTDAGLPHLKGLINLRRISLAGTKVTDAGIQVLREPLREVVIVDR